MSLIYNRENCEGFLTETELKDLYSEAEKALDDLKSGKGAGADYTGWLHLNGDGYDRELDSIIDAANEIKSNSQVLVVIGIGGSYLGARAGLEFVKSPHYNSIKKNTPDIYFIGNSISADAVNETIDMIGDRDFSINIVSKSGTTLEPAIAFRIFRKLLEDKYGKDAYKRIYATTDKNKGVLRKIAEKEGYKTVEIPNNVGGRYSVLYYAGLLPMAVADIDIRAMTKSAAEFFEGAGKGEFFTDPVLLHAAVRNGLYRKGKIMEAMAAFEPSVKYFGEWWKQLFGESEGKEEKGLFPIFLDYSTDLHSIGQYIQEGQRIMMETFIDIEKINKDVTIPYLRDNDDNLDYLANKSLDWANNQALIAAATAHRDGKVPNVTITIKDKSAESFGELVAFFELVCAVSGYMLGVNPFDQPGVEMYKKNLYKLIERP